MREELIKQGFTPYDNGEYLIQSADEIIDIWVIPGKYWSIEIYYNVAGNSILNATFPVSNIHEINAVCLDNGIIFNNIQNNKKDDGNHATNLLKDSGDKAIIKKD